MNTSLKFAPEDENDLKIVNALMTSLFNKLNSLIDSVAKQKPYFIGYEIERITKEEEKNCIIDGVKNLDVKLLAHWTQLHKVLNSWKDFYAPVKNSTMFVHRLPGFVTVMEDHEELLVLVETINKIKDDIATTVRKNRDKHQRHEFIHRAFPGIMTEQLYRKIQIKSEHVNNVWFNWASRPVPKSYTLKEAVEHVEKLKSKPPIDFDQVDWLVQLDTVINDINSGRYHTIQKLKEFRLLPTIEFNLIRDGNKVRTRHNATIPFILFGQENKAKPKHSALSPVNNKTKKDTCAFDPNNKEMIDSHLSLVGVLA